jgi:hypothetical protein
MVRTRRHRPTAEQRHQVLTLASLGIKQEEIAGLLHLAPKTLRLRYRHELDTGTARATVAVAESLFHMATKGRVPAAAIFWMKARAGWKEARDLNIGGTDRPVGIDFTWAPARSPVLTKVPPIDSEAEAEGGDVGDVVIRWEGEKTE